MGVCLFENSGSGVDVDELTAVPSDVLSGKTFIGSGTEDVKTGTMVERGSPSIVLPVNGTYDFPAGRYTGGSVTQNIQTIAGQTVDPGATSKTLSLAGKKLSGNVIVNAVSNLSPGNIKKGVTVGGVTGTYEGYENNDPDQPYYRGTFSPGQGLTKLDGPELGDNNWGIMTYERDYIYISRDDRDHPPVCVLDGPINFSKYKNIQIGATPGSNLGHVHFFERRVYTFLYQDTSGVTTKYNPALGDLLLDSTIITGVGPSEDGVYQLRTDFNVSRTGYCYFSFNRITSFKIRWIKLILK